MSEATVLDRLVEDLAYRMSVLDKRQSASYLNTLSPRDIIEFSYTHVLKGLERKATLVEVAASIGRRLRQKLRMKQDSILDVQGGWYVLISYIETGIIGYRKKHVYKNGKKTLIAHDPKYNSIYGRNNFGKRDSVEYETLSNTFDARVYYIKTEEELFNNENSQVKVVMPKGSVKIIVKKEVNKFFSTISFSCFCFRRQIETLPMSASY